ncbi:tRNA pseudouridine(38/39) synthase [Hyposmocoma kahamanoa]|uniref:tRNA pseudouridine(38/39) synthase n=1 Tax=Hyposmocoma kahamanoa TaxID=1477025 RepID=UPI000E6D6013|nr:tRNA pseudouridine(38/39) synthase [Hyposmocoma kahamanoa]
MEKVPPKPKKLKGATREDLMLMDKNELVEKILQLEAHNAQLKNIISKNLSDDTESEKNGRKKPFDFSKCHYRRVLLRILYFGWDYKGLAVQEDTLQTIEHHLFLALSKSCLIQSRENSQYHRCGRTDKGVSAFGQVISLTLRSKHPPDNQYDPDSISTEISYCKILNRLLPKEIRAVAWMPTPKDYPEYSARFDCKKRKYKYYFPRSNLDIPAMRLACSHLIGSHDFRHLCKMDVGGGVTEFVRTIFSADIVPVDQDFDKATSMYTLTIEGNAFLWHQIRCIMGVLLLIGQSRETPDVMTRLLDLDTCHR